MIRHVYFRGCVSHWHLRAQRSPLVSISFQQIWGEWASIEQARECHSAVGCVLSSNRVGYCFASGCWNHQMGPCWKYKAMCAWLIKKLWILNEMVMRAKTGRVASNGIRPREPEKIICFFQSGSQLRLILLLCYLQKEEQGGAWIHISTIKETVAKLGWPEGQLCDTDKGGALPVPRSHLPFLAYSVAHLVYENLGCSQDPLSKSRVPIPCIQTAFQGAGIQEEGDATTPHK